MQKLFNDIPCIYFIASPEGLIHDVNEPLCQSLGYTREELTGSKLESIFTLSTRIFQQTHFSPLLQLKGIAEELYITLKAKNGKDVPVFMNAVVKEKDGQTYLHFAGIGVSKRKKFEDEIIGAKKAAETALKENTALKATREQLQKNAEELDNQLAFVHLQNQELQQFNHMATHSLQEPVRKLLFFSSQLLETDEEEKKRTITQKMRKATEDINAKLNGLQQYLWLSNEETNWKTVNLPGVIQCVKRQVESENPDVSIILETEMIPPIEANSEQLQFLLKEIFLNAVRFRKPGNVVNLKIYASVLLQNKFRQLTEKYKYVEFLKLQIQDDGVGFNDEYQEQVFELFRKLHPTSGRGIGLSLCKKIVENHHGFISLESEQEAGTKVIIFLPLKRE